MPCKPAYYDSFDNPLCTVAAQKIHISAETKEVLDSFGVFEIELRGDLEVKVRVSIFKDLKEAHVNA